MQQTDFEPYATNTEYYTTPFPWSNYGVSVQELIIGPQVKSLSMFAFEEFNALRHIVFQGATHMCWDGHWPFCQDDGAAGYPYIKTAGPLGSGCDFEYNRGCSFGAHAFSSFKHLTTVTYDFTSSDNKEYVSDYMFIDCYSLSKVTFTSNVTSIGDEAFYGCSSLKEITLPSSVDYIGYGAFAYCASLINIKLPDGIETIEGYAFSNTGLKQLTIPKNWSYVSGQEDFVDSSVTIVGYTNSGAQKYARRYGNTFVNINTVVSRVTPFINRLYSLCLGRKADTTGFNNYLNGLTTGGMTGVRAAYNFIFSPEFKNKNLCNEDFVEYLYKVFMDRSSDAAGKKNWVNKLESGVTREEVFNGFALSNEFSKICSQYGITRGTGISIPKYGTMPTGSCSVCGKQDGVTAFVTRLYQYCLGRTPDSAGLNNWCSQLRNHQITGYQAVRGFVLSTEFTQKNYNNTNFVRQMYKICFDRNADSAGLNNWVSKLNSGTSRESVIKGFAGSQEFIKLCNKYGITPL